MPDETFRVEDGFLVRAVVPRRGRPYEHRCPVAAYEVIAHAIDKAGQPFTLETLAQSAGLPDTQVGALGAVGQALDRPDGREHRLLVPVRPGAAGASPKISP